MTITELLQKRANLISQARALLDLVDKEKRGRLRALCALGVSLGLPLPVMKLLISLPLRRLYEFLDRLWKGYCLRFRIYPYRQSLSSFAADVVLYLRGNYY